MLFLTRRLGDTVLIGDEIRVTVTQIKRNQITLSIYAPKTIPIVRNEIAHRYGTSETADEELPTLVTG